MVHHFALKQELFGTSCDDGILGRDIRLSDLDEEDRALLEVGVFRPLPVRDTAGRSILAAYPRHRPESHISFQSVGRMTWYTFHTMLKDEETQKKGFVAIIYNLGKNARRRPHSYLFRMRRIHEGIPKKCMSVHFCYDDASLRPFVIGMRLFCTIRERTRFRQHFGPNMELELQTYGIPTTEPCLREATDDKLSIGWHRKWIAACQTNEEQQKNDDSTETSVTLNPRRFDVLFGRGSNVREHTGNLRAAHLVEMYQSKYEKARKFEKTAIAERIVKLIHESFGRFLKWDAASGGWVEVDHDAAREKISHFFRHLRSKGPDKKEGTAEERSQVERKTQRLSELEDSERVGSHKKLHKTCPV